MKTFCAKSTGFILAGLTLWIAGCLCSGEPTDEERLKAAIDSTPVHIYLGVKTTLGNAGADPEMKKARDALMALIREAGDSEGSGKDGGSVDALALGKALLSLRTNGSEMTKDLSKDTPPVLPVLLEAVDAPPEVLKAFDADGEHALLFSVMAILKLSEKSPVPIPMEIVLYEAWKTDPAKVKIPGATVPLHASKAWIYAQNDYCDLAAVEAEAAGAQKLSAKDAMAALSMLGVPRGKIEEAKLAKVDAGFKALANGGVALCHYKRGDDKGARPWLSKVVDEAERSGLAAPEDLAYLRVFLDCGGTEKEVKAGMTKLAELERNPADDLKALRAYCEASDETSFELARKVSLTAKLLKVGLAAAEASGATEEMENTKAFSAVKGLATACEESTKGASRIGEALGGLKDSAKGLFE